MFTFGSFKEQDNGQGTFQWVAEKTKSERAGTLAADTMQLLKEVQSELRRTDEDKLFPQHNKQSIATYFCQFFKRTLKVPVQSHDFRTTKITQLLNDQVDLKSVQKYVGHKNPATTLGYQKLDISEANKRIAGLMVSKIRGQATNKSKLNSPKAEKA